MHQGPIGRSNLPYSAQYLLHDSVFSDRSNWGPFAQHRLPHHSTASEDIDVNFEDCLSEETRTPLEDAIDAVWINIRE